MNDLIRNIDRLHTTKMGTFRIGRNLGLNARTDVVSHCRHITLSENANITRRGKNWYISVGCIIITVNATSFTIITAHKIIDKSQFYCHNQIKRWANE